MPTSPSQSCSKGNGLDVEPLLLLATSGIRLVGFGNVVTVTSSVLVPMTIFEAAGANEIGVLETVIAVPPALSVCPATM